MAESKIITQQEFYKRYSYNATSDLLGSGGFGEVFRAWDNVEDVEVALKIQPVKSDYPDLRLVNEVEAAAKLHHPNVAKYKECYTLADNLTGEIDVAVMSYYKDGSLDNLIKSENLTNAQRYDILIQLLEGISYLHRNGIIHRDLKPQNILILHKENRYIPKITDFGISKQLKDGETSELFNSLQCGTRVYASPEQLREDAIRKNTDIWSFGVIAYKMLVGKLPFNSGSFSLSSDEGRNEMFRQMKSGVLPDALNAVAEPWQTLIRKSLVYDNKTRLAHAEDCLMLVDEATHAENELVIKVKSIEVESNSRCCKINYKTNNPVTDGAVNVSSKTTWILNLKASDGHITFTTVANSTTSSRDGVIIVTYCGIKQEIKVRQAGQTKFLLKNHNYVVFSANHTNSIQYTIENAVPGKKIVASNYPSWIRNITVDNNTIFFEVDKNPSSDKRSCSIDFSYNGIKQTLNIVQNGSIVFDLANNYVSFSCGGGERNVSYVAKNSTMINVNSMPSWIKCVEIGTLYVNIKAKKFFLPSKRYDSITLSYGGITRRIGVWQNGMNKILFWAIVSLFSVIIILGGYFAYNYFYGDKESPVYPVENEIKAAEYVEELSADDLYNEGNKCYNAENYTEAVDLYLKAAEQNHAAAQNMLGRCYEQGYGVKQREDEAEKWYRKAADQGYVSAQWNLANIYYNRKDYKETFKLYTLAAEQNHAASQYMLGRCYWEGYSCEQSYDEAAKWYRKAADQGHVYAQWNLADIYYDRKDYKEAFKFYTLAAEQNYAAAQNMLGLCYGHGYGCEQSYLKAANWYRKAADQGYASAQWNLALIYDEAKETERNIKEAIKWYREAANQGDVLSQYKLATYLENGVLDVPKNLSEAKKWYSEAAKQGHEGAQKACVRLGLTW